MKNNIKTYIIAGLILILGIFIGASLFSSEEKSKDETQNIIIIKKVPMLRFGPVPCIHKSEKRSLAIARSVVWN